MAILNKVGGNLVKGTETYKTEGSTFYAFVGKDGALCIRSGERWDTDCFFHALSVVIRSGKNPALIYFRGRSLRWFEDNGEISFIDYVKNKVVYRIS